MSFPFLYYARKYPLFRIACYGCIVLLAIVIPLVFFNGADDNEPEIKSISPQIGAPGSVMTISGSGFGNERDTSFVEIGGSSLTSSSYLSWSATEIKVQLPANVQDGLVYVVTKRGRSQPEVFANKNNIPMAITQVGVQTTLPLIESESPQKIAVGQVLTITGSNFGSIRGENSFVYFTPSGGINKNSDSQDLDSSYIRALEQDFDYEFWSNTEIRVRVPDGAASGNFFVKTDKGVSNQRNLTVTTNLGKKDFPEKRQYLVQLSADISDVDMGANSLITLRVPRPQPSSQQRGITVTEFVPQPIFQDYNKSVIHQLNASQITQEKTGFSQTFVIPVYSVETSIQADKVQKFSDTTRLLYKVYTTPDSCIPSDDEALVQLAKTIVGKESNPYKQAQLIYNYMLENYQLLNQLQPKDIPSVSLISALQGDVYDFAIIFTALCRATGIPAIPVSGILVDNAKNVQNHWWSEIYLENFGWLPVDVALAAGLEFDLPGEIENPREFYFGNLDLHHIAFSRGWNDIHPTIITNKTVYRPKTYGLQSIWEETTTGTINYSSFWSDPVVLGIY